MVEAFGATLFSRRHLAVTVTPPSCAPREPPHRHRSVSRMLEEEEGAVAGNMWRSARMTPLLHGGGWPTSALAHGRTHSTPAILTPTGMYLLIREDTSTDASCWSSTTARGDKSKWARATPTPRDLFNNHILPLIGLEGGRGHWSGQIVQRQVELHDSG